MEVVRVGIVDNDVDMDVSQLNSSKPGYFVELTQTICTQLSYDCQFEVAPTSHYGEFINGSWTGFLSLLQNGTYDTAIPTFTPAQERMLNFDFTQFTMRYAMIMSIRNNFDTETSSQISAFLKPFRVEIWGFILLTILAVSLISFTFKFRENDLKSNFFNFVSLLISNALYLVKRSFALKIPPNFPAAKFSLLAWGFGSMFILCFYVSSLHSALFHTSKRLPVWDFESLVNCLELSECKLIARPGDDIYEEDFTHVDSVSDEVRMRNALKQSGLIKAKNTAEAIELLKGSKSRLVLLAYPYENLKNAVPVGDCSILKIESDVFDFSSFPFRKGASLKPQFDRILHQLQGNGVIKALFSKYFPRNNQCFYTGSKIIRTVKSTSFQISAFSGAFAVLLIGFFLGSLLLVIETIK